MKVITTSHEEVLENLFSTNNGVVKTADVLAAGVPKSAFYTYVKNTGIEKVAHGIYLSPSAWADEMYLLQSQIPKAVYSHETALFLHALSEREPTPLTVTVPAKYNSAMLSSKGVNTVYVKEEWYPMGICTVTSPGGHSVNTYDMERTICDIVRKRSDMDVSVFNYAATTYMKRRDKNLNHLMHYAKTMGLYKKIWDTLGVLF